MLLFFLQIKLSILLKPLEDFISLPVFLPGKSHGQRSLAGYSPWGHKRVRHDLATKQQQQRTVNSWKGTEGCQGLWGLSPSDRVKVTQPCLTPCDPMDYTVHGILQARILEWVAFPFFRDLPNPGIKPRSPALQADSSPAEPPGKPK